MRCSLTNRRQSSDGFTLIEILIIAPVVILAISGFVALMIVMAADVLVTRDQNSMTYETQDALDLIEQDTRLSTQFLVTSQALPSPQGSNDNFTGTAAFTSTGGALIMGGLTTTKNPADSTRKIVFYAGQPNVCGPLESYNRPFLSKLIYFIKDGSLWRRVVLPDYNTNVTLDDNTVCGAPWQRNTCSPGYSPATRCQTNDSEIMQNVDSFNVKYFNTPESTTDVGPGNATSATTIEVTLNGKKKTAGKDITTSASLRATRLNSIDVEIPAPGSPDVVSQLDGHTVTFSWPKVPLASSYAISYNVNGGSWTNATLNSQTTSYSVTGQRGDTITIQVTARNSTGNSPTTTVSATVPLWQTCNLQAGWKNYGSGYATAEFTKTSADIVQLKGVIKEGAVTPGTVICTLPVGFRPSAALVFQVGTEPANATRIDVNAAGQVMIGDTNTNPTWTNLSDIRFVAGTAPYTPITLTPIHGWSHFNLATDYFSQLQVRKDTYNRVFMQGVIKGGTMSDGVSYADLPIGYRPTEYYHYPTRSNAAFNYTGVSTVDGQYKAINTAGANAFYAPQAMFYSTSTAAWPNLTLQNSWSAYPGYTVPKYTKAADGLVTLKGLIRNGTNNVAIATPLPAGYRPKERIVTHGVACNAYARIDIDTNGSIYAINTSPCWTSLDNITFIADQ